MSKELLIKILFVPVMLLFIAVPSWMIIRYEAVLNDGDLFRFQARPVDPYDAFRGRYITLSYTAEQNVLTSLCPDTLQRGDRVYVSLAKDPEGYAMISFISKEPLDVPSFEAEVRYIYDEEMTLQFPFDRYFMNEEMAPLAEKAVRDNLRIGEDNNVYIDVRVGDGKAVIEQIYIDDMPLLEFLEGLPKEEEE